MAMDQQNFTKKCRKIVAAGRNYHSLAKQLGREIPSEPMLFLKAVTSLVEEGGNIEVPSRVQDVMYEVELAVIISKHGTNVPLDSAMEYVGGYALALDMTAHDVLTAHRGKGHPWSIAKGFDTFCPISKFLDKSALDPSNSKLWLKVDGELKQSGSTTDMIFSVPYLISYISGIFTLEVGDVILTGTPAGVGLVKPGQTISAGIGGVVDITFPVVQRKE